MISRLDIQLSSQKLTKVTRRHVQQILRYISDDDLVGLGVIRVIEECSWDYEEKRYPPYFAGHLVNGHYQKSDGKKPAEVVLYASDIYFGIPHWLVGSSVALLKIADTLAHEIGHHVFAKQLGKHTRVKAYQQNLRNPEEEAGGRLCISGSPKDGKILGESGRSTCYKSALHYLVQSGVA
jgi:hypothetical protein